MGCEIKTDLILGVIPDGIHHDVNRWPIYSHLNELPLFVFYYVHFTEMCFTSVFFFLCLLWHWEKVLYIKKLISIFSVISGRWRIIKLSDPH